MSVHQVLYQLTQWVNPTSKPKLDPCQLTSRVQTAQKQAWQDSPCVQSQSCLVFLYPTETTKDIPPTYTEWHLHLGLLMHVYQRTSDEDLKKQICFLALNFLYKAAPICPSDIAIDQQVIDRLMETFQLGIWNPGISYNRESNIFDSILEKEILSNVAPSSGKSFVLVDALDIDDLLRLHFALFCSDDLDRLEAHLQNFDQDPEDEIDLAKTPILIDCTSHFGSLIHTESDFANAFHLFEERINHLINHATANKSKKLQSWLRLSMIFICKCKVKNIPFLKILPLFRDTHPHPDSLRGRPSYYFNKFLNHTGLRLGSVVGRTLLSTLLPLEQLVTYYSGQLVKYACSGPNTLYFSERLELTSKSLFTRLQKDFESQESYLSTLGKPTLDLISGVLQEISEEKWQSFNADLDKRELIQNCLYRIFIYLGNAEGHKENFVNFAQDMEMIHYELAALIAIFEPFKNSNFSEIYAKRLDYTLPLPLQNCFRAGITKSAMNTFAGIHSILGANCRTVYTKGSHFEFLDILGENRCFEDVQSDGKIAETDLYLGEFNHNISLYADSSLYTSSNLIQEIEVLLQNRSIPLTAAIDCTIDYVNSPKISGMLQRFTQEILDGKILFIFFQSGQKFWLYGMDHMYGSPFYMIHNGDPYWKRFDKLLTHESFTTDPLSTQWFCLVNKYTPYSDTYRKAIFENTKALLTKVPKSLLPEMQGPIRVSQISSDVETCFLDIKCYGDASCSAPYQLQEMLYKRFTDHKQILYSRAGYGYYHPNLVKFRHGFDKDVQYTTLRITLGINAGDNVHLEAFLDEAEMLAKTFT